MSELSTATAALTLAASEIKEAKESFEEIRVDADVAINEVNTNFAEKAASLTIMATDGYRKAIEDASGGRNTVIYDAQGNPNIMVVIPRFNVEDLGLDELNLGTGTHPAFKTNGVDRSEILIGKYLASEGINEGCSVIGGVQPKTIVDYDEAKLLCTQKGEGWHLMSAHEWAAIALWSLANGTVPRGNTNYGQSHDKKWEVALREDGNSPGEKNSTGATKTGSGPNTWAHDHAPCGVQDLVGNVFEWIDQMKLDEGQIVSTLDNDPFINESDWFKHSAFFDSLTDENLGDVGSPILSNSLINRNGSLGDNSYQAYAHNELFSMINKSESYINSDLLRKLLIESDSTSALTGGIWVRNYGERLPLRGGDWSNLSWSGLGAMLLHTARNGLSSHFGFRPTYFL